MPRQNRLSDLPDGTTAIISRLPGGLPNLVRLREMGVLPGTKVLVVRRAPLGDPLELNIRGALISLRRTEAELIEVEMPSRVAAAPVV